MRFGAQWSFCHSDRDGICAGGPANTVSYFEFLARWYNLPFLALVLAGFAAGLAARLRRRRATALSTGLIAAGIVGLTWNGALHDLGLNGYATRFPVVLASSALIGAFIGITLDRARRRLFPAVEGLAFTVPGLEGSLARVVSREVGTEPGSGRAQWRDEDGVMHVVRVHAADESLPFGREVRLVTFDSGGRSYLVETA